MTPIANKILVRFAPSPTGDIHVGNARTALINWLFAKSVGGQFMLRMDYTDQDRSKPEFEKGIQEDLTWLGMAWDKFAQQKDRFDRYKEAMDQLIEAGRFYPCFETPEELSLKRKSLLSRGLPPIYDRGALKLTEEEKNKLIAEGRRPHWRFKLDDRDIIWDDLVRGKVHFKGLHISDPVLVREDEVPLYTLASVVDDIDFGVTHVVRGEDHVANTAVQVQILEALGGTVPVYAHMALIADKEGGGLSKRLGSLSVRSLKDEGVFPMALNSLMAKIGTSDPIEIRSSMDALVEEFDFSKFGRATAKFDFHELEQLNAKYIHSMTWGEAEPLLKEQGYDQIAEPFWEAVRANLTKLSDIQLWWTICEEDINQSIDEPDFLVQAENCLPEGDVDGQTWGVWIDALKQASGRKGKQLFMPLRLALTGRVDGPELKTMLPLLGREKIVHRLRRALKKDT